jgi:hypothetical protein
VESPRRSPGLPNASWNALGTRQRRHPGRRLRRPLLLSSERSPLGRPDSRLEGWKHGRRCELDLPRLVAEWPEVYAVAACLRVARKQLRAVRRGSEQSWSLSESGSRLSIGARTSRSTRSTSRASSLIQVHIVASAFGNRSGSLPRASSELRRVGLGPAPAASPVRRSGGGSPVAVRPAAASAEWRRLHRTAPSAPRTVRRPRRSHAPMSQARLRQQPAPRTGHPTPRASSPGAQDRAARHSQRLSPAP